jgi:putative ABC transport system substrate-binding protein
MAVTSAEQLEGAFRKARKAGSTALAVTLSRLIHRNRERIVKLAIKYRLPAMYSDSRPVRTGGLMSYAPDRNEQYRRAATYVDKILKGARPADLPVQRPTKFDLVVNLKTAKALGITIPASILLRATDVIE